MVVPGSSFLSNQVLVALVGAVVSWTPWTLHQLLRPSVPEALFAGGRSSSLPPSSTLAELGSSIDCLCYCNSSVTCRVERELPVVEWAIILPSGASVLLSILVSFQLSRCVVRGRPVARTVERVGKGSWGAPIDYRS